MVDKKQDKADNNERKSGNKKLGYKLYSGLHGLPETIEALEKEVAELQQQTHAEIFY